MTLSWWSETKKNVSGMDTNHKCVPMLQSPPSPPLQGFFVRAFPVERNKNKKTLPDITEWEPDNHKYVPMLPSRVSIAQFLSELNSLYCCRENKKKSTAQVI